MTGGKVELTCKVDPQLLGGIQVRLGDMLIDGSVRGRLERLRTKLASGVATPDSQQQRTSRRPTE